ncbi:MAG TPA: hypothetical protein VJ793_01355 [Anaerolineae bacterium]|nr:hypothetical protein [Anaerolineae bacterium]
MQVDLSMRIGARQTVWMLDIRRLPDYNRAIPHSVLFTAILA